MCTITLAFLLLVSISSAYGAVYEEYDIIRVNVIFSEVYTFDINNTKEYVLVYPETNVS